MGEPFGLTALAESVALAQAQTEIRRLRRALEDRAYATVYERTAWHHDIGEHDGSEHPYGFCPRCEMEHPKGAYAVLRAAALAAVRCAPSETWATHEELRRALGIHPFDPEGSATSGQAPEDAAVEPSRLGSGVAGEGGAPTALPTIAEERTVPGE